MKCCLCETPMQPFLEKLGYVIYRCPTCGLGQTKLDKDYDTFVRQEYSKGFFTGNPRFMAYSDYKKDKPYILRNLKKFLKRFSKHKPSGRLLDVGCAMGFFVEYALSKGYDAYGFDPSDYAVKESSVNLAGRIQKGTIGSVKYAPKSFDVITLFDVFEHLNYPREDLRKLRTLLKDDGIIVIATGNTNSLMARLLKKKWTFYIPPQHLFFFDTSTLTKILHMEGFEPVGWFQVGKWLSLQYVLHLARTDVESKLGDVLYRIVMKINLGMIPMYLPVRDNMVVIAEKRV